jgi:formyltetrahydrofolate-dependent phosphoribosylglycinamide formyltransferase
MTLRLVVLASGSGSNLQAIIDAITDGMLDATVCAVATNRADAFAIERAASAGITAVVVEPSAGEDRRTYDARLAAEVASHSPDLIVLAGWMRLLSMAFLARFPGRVVNLHPALPGELPGTHAIERAFDEACQGARDHSGVMVHYVPDEGVDDGPVIASAQVGIRSDDTLDAFAVRMHAAEHALLVRALGIVAAQLPRPVSDPPPSRIST